MTVSMKEKYQRFREWQKQPYQVRPLSVEEHDCATCGTHYQGNYCPRCGQSSTVGRYSFKNAFLLFLDVWGLGNRGMFRTLRDLLLRPGYMIRDYLQGMQMAYFPPFKMFFLLIAFSVIVDSGFNIKLENRFSTEMKQAMDRYADVGVDDLQDDDDDEKTEAQQKNTEAKKVEVKRQKTDDDAKVSKEDQEMVKKVEKVKKVMDMRSVSRWLQDHQTIFQLLWLLVFSAPLYLFFRRSPNIPDIRYSEFFVAMVYTTNLMTMASIVCGLFCLGINVELLTALLSLIPLKQLSGYSYKRTLLNVVVAFIIVCVVGALLVGSGIGIFVALFGQ